MPAEGERRQITIQKPHLLLVEGLDDIAFFVSLANKLPIENLIQIIPYEGKANLRAALTQIKLAPLEADVDRIITLGIARDSDEDNAFRSICHAFRDTGYAVPHAPLTVKEGEPQTIIMLFPDESNPGALEDLCLRAFEGDVALGCVEDYLNCLLEQSISLRASIIAKAKLQVFFASRDEDGLFLRRAVQRSWWPWDHPAFDEAKHFLELLVSS